MQAGIVYGYIGQTEYIIEKMKEESGLTDVKVDCYRWSWKNNMGRIQTK